VNGRRKHSAVADNARLREARRSDREYIRWCHERFAELGRQVRAWRARAEIAEGRLAQCEQLVERQTAQLMERDSRIAELERLAKTVGDDTVETPRPAALAAA
jgi:chromosome segregation ATPase